MLLLIRDLMTATKPNRMVMPRLRTLRQNSFWSGWSTNHLVTTRHAREISEDRKHKFAIASGSCAKPILAFP
nr:hypothetical protein [uncultured bacterium]